MISPLELQLLVKQICTCCGINLRCRSHTEELLHHVQSLKRPHGPNSWTMVFWFSATVGGSWVSPLWWERSLSWCRSRDLIWLDSKHCSETGTLREAGFSGVVPSTYWGGGGVHTVLSVCIRGLFPLFHTSRYFEFIVILVMRRTFWL